MNLEFKANYAGVRAYDRWDVIVEASGVAEGDILDHFSVEAVVSHFGEDVILDNIGEDAVRKYFGIEENEEE